MIKRDGYGFLKSAIITCEECGLKLDLLDHFYFGLFKCPHCETVYSLKGVKIASYKDKEVAA